MSSFLKKFNKAALIDILNKLNDNTYKSKWKKAELIEQIQEYGAEKYCKTLDTNQLKVGLKFHELKETGRKNTLLKRLVDHLDDGSNTHTMGSDSDSSRSYTILVKTGKYTCTCPDFHYRGHLRPCRHIKKLKKEFAAQGGFTEEEEVIDLANFPGKVKCLLIGNSEYKGSPLANPKNDATRLQKVLKSLGHTTQLLLDGTRKQMDSALNKFERSITSKQGVVLYFSGHGCEIDGSAHMMPIESSDRRSGSDAYGINVDEIISRFEEAKFRIIILDACRAKIDAPLAGSPDASLNTIRWYATSRSKLAYDGWPGGMSPFTTCIVEHMGTKKSIFEIIMSVQLDILLKHGELQVPETTTTMTKNWFPKYK